MDGKPKIILLAGPTASGKSKIAIRLSKLLNGEIINADSMQVYKELRILNSRPTANDEKKIKQHLYGIISVKNKFSTGYWLKLATKKIKEILKKNKTSTNCQQVQLRVGLKKLLNVQNYLVKPVTKPLLTAL